MTLDPDALHDLYRLVVENASHAMAVVQDGVVQMANDPARRLVGLLPGEGVGLHLDRFVHPEDLPLVADRHIRRMKGETVPETYEIRLCGPDGQVHWVEVRVVAFPWRGRPAALVLVVDVNERKRTETALATGEAWLQAVLKTAAVSIAVVGNDGRFLQVNDAWSKLFGYSVEESRDLSASRLAPIEHKERWEALIRSLWLGGLEHFHEEVVLVQKGGRRIWCDLSLRPIRQASGRVAALVGVAQDITERKWTVEELARTKEDWERTFDLVPDLIAVIDTEYRLVRVNRAMADRMGVSAAEAVNRRCFELVHKTSGPPLDCPHRHLLKDGRAHTADIQVDDPSGDLAVTVVPIVDPDGRLAGAIHVARDMTSWNRTQAVLARQVEVSTAVAELSQALISSQSIDDIGCLVLDKAKQLTTSRHGFVGFIDPVTGYLVSSTLTREIWGKCQVPEKTAVFQHFTGLWGWVLTHRTPIRTNSPTADPRSRGLPEGHLPIERFLSVPALVNDQLVGAIALANSARDYTEEDQAVIHRLATLYALAIQRKRVMDKLQAATDAALAANQAKGEFLANISHEIRTPLTGVMGMTDLALDTDLTEEQRDYLVSAKASASALLALINELLDFAKIDAGRIHMEHAEFQLDEVLDESLEPLARRAQAKGLALAYGLAPDLPRKVLGDPVRLRQILINLVDNAIKFTPQGEVVVRLESRDRSLGSLQLHGMVEDTGIGVPRQKQEAIFSPFTQADGSTTRLYGGTGLGLTIAARLARLMDGGLWMESEPDKGSRFHFVLRLGIPADAGEWLDETARAAFKGKRVLVADPHEAQRRFLLETLGHWGFEAVGSADEGEARQAVSGAAKGDGFWDLILMDVDWATNSGGSGVPTLCPLAPLIRSSAYESTGPFLFKPVRTSGLADVLRRVFRVAGRKEAKRVESAARTVPAGGGLTLLLAEDNLINQKWLRTILTKRGHQVLTASTGVEVLEILSLETVDLVLMDVQMPDMDGLTATAAIRAREPEGRRLPIIAMTAHAMKGDRERFLAAGMDGYLAKPIEAGVLIQTVESGFKKMVEHPPAETEDPPAVWARSLARMGGDEELLRELARDFIQLAPEYLDRIDAALAKGDPRALEMAAHTLKGAASGFEARPTQMMAQALEEAGRNQDLGRVQDLRRRLTREIDRLHAELTRWAPPA